MPGVVAWLNSLLPLAPSQPVWEIGMAVSPSEKLGIRMSGNRLGKPRSYLQALMEASESWEAPRNPGSQILHSGQHQGPNLTLVGTFTYPAVLLRKCSGSSGPGPAGTEPWKPTSLFTAVRHIWVRIGYTTPK